MAVDYLDTPIGLLEIGASESGLTRVIFCESKNRPVKTNSLVNLAKQQLTDYFNGERQRLELPLAQRGTDFQETVWRYLQTIGFGETVSYTDVAHGIGKPKAVRAVGTANGKNRLSIIVPCHRVIGHNGALAGYAGGVARKKWLLEHEGAVFKT